MTISLGMKGRDAITGFEGIVVGVCRYLTGCDTVLLVPPVDGSVKGGEDGGRWFDVDRVEVTPKQKPLDLPGTTLDMAAPGEEPTPPRVHTPDMRARRTGADATPPRRW